MRPTLQIGAILIASVCFSPYTKPLDATNNREIFENKKIVILGGTGYLGRALTTTILNYNPKEIRLFSRDEVKHFHCVRYFHKNPKIKHIIGDIRDYNSVLKATMAADIVLHAAALKRMDILEENVEESIKTNILGSINVFNACIENKVPKALFVSTDKACSPINTYGACKFVSEKLFTNYNKQEINTQFTVARYGNVLESTGSLIPIVKDRIKRNEDLLITDVRMTRFIINKDEAVQLIFDALRYGVGGEIFVKELPAFNVTDVVDVLKTKFQATNNVRIIGIRPGEKLHEVLINEDEIPRTYKFGDCFVITPTIVNGSNEDKTPIPPYITRGQHTNTSMRHFSSNHAIIPQEELAKIFEQLDSLQSPN